jgi:hypothetical protein
VSDTVELVVIERAGQRLALPSARVSAIGELPRERRALPLQERFGQPPLGDGERCVGVVVRMADGHRIVPVAGRVMIATVAAAEIAPLPPLLAAACPVAAVVFGAEAATLVLDPDAAIGESDEGGGRR